MKRAFEKIAHEPVFRAEMLVTKDVLSRWSHLVTAFGLQTLLRLSRAFCRSLVVEGRVVGS